jgi:aspartate racemase
MTSPTVGILAGMGPFSTGPFVDMVAAECQRQYGARHDIDFPRLMICSQPAPFYEDRPVDHAALEEAIRDGLRRLEETGAAFLAIACNTAHIYYPALAAGVKVPLLDMVELAVAALPAEARRVAVVAARPTADAGIYQQRLAARGFAVVEGGWQDDVDKLLAATRTSREPVLFTTLWTAMLEKARVAGADTLLVACLDLSGVLKHAVTAVRVVDAAQALAEEIVAQWLVRRSG